MTTLVIEDANRELQQRIERRKQELREKGAHVLQRPQYVSVLVQVDRLDEFSHLVRSRFELHYELRSNGGRWRLK